jgi:hypothetical protein
VPRFLNQDDDVHISDVAEFYAIHKYPDLKAHKAIAVGLAAIGVIIMTRTPQQRPRKAPPMITKALMDQYQKEPKQKALAANKGDAWEWATPHIC